MTPLTSAPITEPSDLYQLLSSFLIANGICRNRGDFSRRFLNRSRTYWATAEAADRSPSITACLWLVKELDIQAEAATLKDTTRAVLRDFAQHVRADIAHRVGGAS